MFIWKERRIYLYQLGLDLGQDLERDTEKMDPIPDRHQGNADPQHSF
jgi:hypothetical protein